MFYNIPHTVSLARGGGADVCGHRPMCARRVLCEFQPAYLFLSTTKENIQDGDESTTQGILR